MAELSRIKKYKDLRESIAQDLDSNDVTTTKELSRFQKRLNQIDANNFHRSGDYTERVQVKAFIVVSVHQLQKKNLLNQ